MTIPEKTIYPRTGDYQTIYLNAAIDNPAIAIGDYTIYNDFVHDPPSLKKIMCCTTIRLIKIDW